MGLFQLGGVTLSSGEESQFKIDCDALSYADWDCVAYMASRILPPFRAAYGLTDTNGNSMKFAAALTRYETEGSELPAVWCDDVLTTGATLRRVMRPGHIGVVAFARSEPPEDIYAVFSLTPFLPG